ncbi:MAG: chemotaxis protein CheW [Deltaproteobacteria bacterium]|nr:chemotaxis protein CheW [Deltaproteobacteria bacterium]
MARADLIRFVTFSLDEVTYGVEVRHLQEVLTGHDISPVPLADPAIMGLMNLRGQVVTALDLRKVLHHQARTQLTEESLHVVVEHSEGLLSILVDAYGNYVERPAAFFKPPPSLMSPSLSSHLSGVCELEDRRIVMMLDVESFLSPSSDELEP